ncbi:hypothetical protein P1X14_11175 [Sphingomonas sp. AOB5]|uniref:hypothetical protein n=1 Tax=Sphingomonas sp. AOB5 TaxID=3034017 RepID=UPI0023F7C19F|nr:hypothetical protein [Sphingomonas sp. AOB5]MDF7775809.1 hypothetical protein [Sphingomonas sp. AOB5]
MTNWLHRNGALLALWASAILIPLGFATSALGFFANTSAFVAVMGLVMAFIGAIGFVGSWAAYQASKAREAFIDSQLDWSIQMTLWNSEMIAARSPQF